MDRLSRQLVALGLVALLASCGGGGGSGDTSTSIPPTTTGTGTGTGTTVTIYDAPANVAVPAATSDRATNAFNWSNFRRAQIGLAPFNRNPALDRAAGAHVNYIALNNSYSSEGHSETPGKPGFTGSTVDQRTAAAGYGGLRIGENIAGLRSTLGIEATDSLVDAPYHRQTQLGDFADAGAAASSAVNAAYVIDFGGTNPNLGPGLSQLVVYPAKGATGAPIDWLANEIPNPVPDLAGQRVGYPISISAGAQPLTIANFTLSNDKGISVTSRLLTTRTDTSASLRTYAFLVPLAPLAAATPFTARATGSVGSTAFDVSWSFTTLAVAPLVATPSVVSLGSAPGSSLTITMSGGTGRFDVVASSSYSYFGAPPAPTEFFTSELVSPGVLKLVRNNTACNGNLLNCRAAILGQDSSGTQVSLNLVVN